MSSISDFLFRLRPGLFAGCGLTKSDLTSSFLDLLGVFSFLIVSVFPISLTDEPVFRPLSSLRTIKVREDYLYELVYEL